MLNFQLYINTVSPQGSRTEAGLQLWTLQWSGLSISVTVDTTALVNKATAVDALIMALATAASSIAATNPPYCGG